MVSAEAGGRPQPQRFGGLSAALSVALYLAQECHPVDLTFLIGHLSYWRNLSPDRHTLKKQMIFEVIYA